MSREPLPVGPGGPPADPDPEHGGVGGPGSETAPDRGASGQRRGRADHGSASGRGSAAVRGMATNFYFSFAKTLFTRYFYTKIKESLCAKFLNCTLIKCNDQ